MSFGFTGKIIHLDLTSGSITIEEPPESFYRKYLGGSAMGMVYILKEMPRGTGALDPAAVMTVMVSPTTGAAISGQSRININARSPMSGAIGDSQGGGFFPAEFKFAGFDGLVIKGRSEKPVYLRIMGGKPELHDAAHLVGKPTAELDDLLKAEVGDPKAEVMQYGPAAEAGVRFASIVNMANRNNGRTGMGLVMASKNLKAIVVRSSGKYTPADQKGITELSRQGIQWLPTNADVEPLGKYGTAVVVNVQNMMGTLPVHNYNEGQWDQQDPISGETLYDTVLKERHTCYACAVKCKRVVEITEGPYLVDPVYGGPEYETLSTFGSYCGINNLAAVCRANMICNMYGVDTITCGATIAFAMECYEKGIIGPQETGGLDLCFGNADAMLAALDQIVTNTGPLGKVLSQGSAHASQVWGKGSEDFLITVKNQEAPAHMPQAKRSLAVIYAVNPFGADHQSSEHDPMYEEGCAQLYLNRLAELDLKDVQPYASLGPEKVRFAYYGQVFYSLLDTLDLCQFVWGPAWTLYGPTETLKLVQAATGWPVSMFELMKAGERRINLMKVFNAREGFSRKDDKLPKKFFQPLGGGGPTGGVALSEAEVESALDLYYQFAGWTPDGIPTPARLADLGIGWAAEQLP